MAAAATTATTAAPQTGLGILMGGKPAPLLAPQKFAPSSPHRHLTPDQQNRIQEDLADRERQAAALASAGMLTADGQPITGGGVGQVLQAPPPLVSMVPHHPSSGGVSPNKQTSGSAAQHHNGDVSMEAINWNAIPELGSPDDMDMDFAAMFDTEQEQSFMAHPGHPTLPNPGGPPASSQGGGPTKTGIPNPLNSN